MTLCSGNEVLCVCMCVHLASVLNCVGIKMVSGVSCPCLTLAFVGTRRSFPRVRELI